MVTSLFPEHLDAHGGERERAERLDAEHADAMEKTFTVYLRERRARHSRSDDES